MGERTSYPPGTFSWAELATSDADAAKAFYASVLGWEYRDTPIPDGSVYSTALRDGKDVAALFSSDEQPPHWNCYVTVESANDTASAPASSAPPWRPRRST
jgi:predicted enzyme related to lactoylglutathione lyase